MGRKWFFRGNSISQAGTRGTRTIRRYPSTGCHASERHRARLAAFGQPKDTDVSELLAQLNNCPLVCLGKHCGAGGLKRREVAHLLFL